MKAVQFHEYGETEVLHLEDAPRPSPADDEILVHIHAAGVNPVDAKLRAGMRGGGRERFPQVAGLDFAGFVDTIGKRVRAFAIRDEVYSRVSSGRQGSYAQFVVVKEGDIAKKPRSIAFGPAAALPTAALTAWQALFSSRGTPTMNLQKGQTVLIDGASGGVGSFAVQLAKWAGAKVAATARGENEAYVRGLGADVFIDYEKVRFDELVHDVDAALDVVGRDTQLKLLGVIKRGGVLVSTVGIQVADEARAAGVRTIPIVAATDAAILEEIAKLVDDGVVMVPVSEELPLEQAREAHKHIESGHTRGKSVLDVH